MKQRKARRSGQQVQQSFSNYSLDFAETIHVRARLGGSRRRRENTNHASSLARNSGKRNETTSYRARKRASVFIRYGVKHEEAEIKE